MNQKNEITVVARNIPRFFPDPEWQRAEGIEWMFGIKAGTLYNLLELGLVNARFKRVRGEQKAMTLWEVKSVRDYILNPQTDMPKTGKRTEAH